LLNSVQQEKSAKPFVVFVGGFSTRQKRKNAALLLLRFGGFLPKLTFKHTYPNYRKADIPWSIRMRINIGKICDDFCQKNHHQK